MHIHIYIYRLHTCMHMYDYTCKYKKNVLCIFKITKSLRHIKSAESYVVKFTQKPHLQTGPGHHFNLILNSDTCAVFLLIPAGHSIFWLPDNEMVLSHLAWCLPGCNTLIPPHVLYIWRACETYQ